MRDPKDKDGKDHDGADRTLPDGPTPARPVYRNTLPPPSHTATGAGDGTTADGDGGARALSLAPWEVAADPSGSVATAMPTPLDAGALAARRTVIQSKRKTAEHFPLAEPTAEGTLARARMLTSLAEGQSGRSRASLLTAAAALHDELGDDAAALALFKSALVADPEDGTSLRALREEALRVGDHPRATALLTREVRLPDLSRADVAQTNLLLAALHGQHGRHDDAEQCFAAALQAQPHNVAARLAMARAQHRRDRPEDAAQHLEHGADAWNDPRCASAALVLAAQGCEDTAPERARGLYARAAAMDTHAVDARLGVARAALRRHAWDLAANALLSAAATDDTTEALATAQRRAGARIAHLATGAAEDAATRLRNATDVPSLHALVEAARDAGDDDRLTHALGALLVRSEGTERGFLDLALAELQSAKGDAAGALGRMDRAAAVDGVADAADVMREWVARRAGDDAALRVVRSARAQSGTDSALVAAANLATDAQGHAAEKEWVLRARTQGESPAMTDVLALDLAAASDDRTDLIPELQRLLAKGTGTPRAAAHLMLAELAEDDGDVPGAIAHLREALTCTGPHPVLTRKLVALLGASPTKSPTDVEARAKEAARLLDGTSGTRAASLATWVGRILSDSAVDATPAYRMALLEVPNYAPAVAALDVILAHVGDSVARAELHEAHADTLREPVAAAEALTRAALLRLEDDRTAAANLLLRAHDLLPTDMLLLETLLSYHGSLPDERRAILLEAGIAGASDSWARALRLRAASYWGAAGQLGKAAAIYREHASGEDVVARRGLDRVEIAAGEVARVGARRFQELRDARALGTRVGALEALADLDLYERHDANAAVVSFIAILEITKDHIPSLRQLERHYMDQGRLADLASVEHELVNYLADPQDVTAHARLCARLSLQGTGALGEFADDVLIRAGERGEMDLWLARRLIAAARRVDNPAAVAKGAAGAIALLGTDLEKASAHVTAAEALLAADKPALAESHLAAAVALSPHHPSAATLLAQCRIRLGDHRGAALAFETAGSTAASDAHATSLWFEAARLWQDQLTDLPRAESALTQVVERDASFGDAAPRLSKIFTDREDWPALRRLHEARIRRGGEVPVMVATFVALADLCERVGDDRGAVRALRSSLALDPEHIDLWERLAHICLRHNDHRGAAEALIRVGQGRRDPNELRHVFHSLGDIYDAHLKDPARAETAFRRALAASPKDESIMRRLADLHERKGESDKAAELFRDLASATGNTDQARHYRIRHARMLESQGQARAAEDELERLRKDAPTQMDVIRAVAEFYQRQGATAAEQLHLGRSVSELRDAFARNPQDESLVPNLVDVLRTQGRTDGARCAASVAIALGVTKLDVASMVDREGGIPGAGPLALDEALDDVIAPESLPATTRALLAAVSDIFAKAMPMDLRAFDSERLSPKDPRCADVLPLLKNWLDANVVIHETNRLPRVCIPTGDGTMHLLIGRQLLESTTFMERAFLFTRAAKIAKARMSILVRTNPADLATALAGMAAAFGVKPREATTDPRAAAAIAQRFTKALSKRELADLRPLAEELATHPHGTAAALTEAAWAVGDRAALLAVGSAPAAMGALLKVAGNIRPMTGRPDMRATALTRAPEALSLVQFAMSEEHFEARQRTGVDKKPS